jgi:hypothetical protein
MPMVVLELNFSMPVRNLYLSSAQDQTTTVLFTPGRASSVKTIQTARFRQLQTVMNIRSLLKEQDVFFANLYDSLGRMIVMLLSRANSPKLLLGLNYKAFYQKTFFDATPRPV